MTIESFNDGWAVRPKTSIFAELQGAVSDQRTVTLPHDALFEVDRSADSGEGSPSGYFPGGAFEYWKSFDVPESYRGKRVTLELQGVYRDAMVYVNGDFAAQRPFGYSTFFVPLDAFLRYGESNTIRVDARAHQDSRWYTGAGIHRDTRLHVTDLVHIEPTGLRVTTPDVDDERAAVQVAVTVRNESIASETITVACSVVDANGATVASDTAPVTLRAGEAAVVRQRMFVVSPRRWSVEDPYLYSVVALAHDAGGIIERRESRFGIRVLQIDPIHGLRINGQTTKLRGACIHHDNGILGAAAIGRAEERRVEILKAAGFNAIRSAHNPISEAMLDACDRLGMLVMDETFDMWAESKSAFDYSLDFAEWWERDIEAMVAKDFNHPSVLFYSIGNEIPETGSNLGATIGRALAEKVRTLDPTRFVTNGINGFVSTLVDVVEMMKQRGADGGAGGVNDLMGNAGDFMNQVSASPLVTEKTAESFSVLDVAGINYGDGRYAIDRELFPNRIIVGTETFPTHIDVNWKLVNELPHVIGDFTWTGWDYLGESGIGRVVYTDEGAPPSLGAPFPWLAAWCGDIDITGHRRPVSYYRETVFGLRHEPYIAVQRPENYGRPIFAGQWAWSDSVSSWSWDVAPGAPIVVEVYSDSEEVELLLNGRSVGRQRVGAARAFQADFTLEYERGELTAVAYSQGEETGRSSIGSAHGETRLVVIPDRTIITADDRDLCFVEIELRDEHGNLANAEDRPITVRASGAGTLRALGSARPDPTERYDLGTHTSFDGRLLAIVRPAGPGTITLTVETEGMRSVSITIEAVAPESAGVDIHTAGLVERVAQQ